MSDKPYDPDDELPGEIPESPGDPLPPQPQPDIPEPDPAALPPESPAEELQAMSGGEDL